MKDKCMPEFSKWAMRMFIYVWVFAVFYGAFFLLAELIIIAFLNKESSITIEFAAWATLVTVPLTAGGISYYKKAAQENQIKLKKIYSEDSPLPPEQ